MLFEETEQKLLQGYLLFLLNDKKKGKSIIGKFLKSPADLKQNKGFIHGIAALISINEAETIDSKADEFLKDPKVMEIPIFRVLIPYLHEAAIPTETPDYLTKYVQKYLKPSNDFSERLQFTNSLLIDFLSKELDMPLVTCPICHFNIPTMGIKVDSETICPNCGSSLVYDKFENMLIRKPKTERPIATTSQPKARDLSQLQEEAASALEKAQLALAYFNQGQIQKAIEQMEAALDLQGDDPEILGAAAKFFFDLGEIEKAIDCLEELESIDPEDTEVIGMLTNAYLQLDLKKEAITRLYRLLELDPSNDYAKRLLEKLETDEADFSNW
ncbi:MAG: tetratricopeptide repeat protein [Promethearchaeota archaeon]